MPKNLLKSGTNHLKKMIDLKNMCGDVSFQDFFDDPYFGKILYKLIKKNDPRVIYRDIPFNTLRDSEGKGLKNPYPS